VQKILKELPRKQADLVKGLAPNLITVSGIQHVLEISLGERVSIRDLVTSSKALPTASPARASR
jgi:flagellar biosynthesis protein FlhA